MARLTFRFLAALLVTLVLLDILGLVWVLNGASPGLPFLSPPPTATAIVTPPPVTVPRAPEYVHFQQEQGASSSTREVTWADRSDDEDGFRIKVIYSYGGKESYSFTVPANTTSFVIPGSVPLGCARYDDEPSYGTYWIAVSAYNAAGESKEPMVGYLGNCPTPMPRKPTPASK